MPDAQKNKLGNAVGGYSDRDGVNFRFVNDGMNTTPTDVKVEIRFDIIFPGDVLRVPEN